MDTIDGIDGIDFPRPRQLLRTRAVDCIYAQYSDLLNVSNMPHTACDNYTNSASDEAYKMALFMNRHQGILSITYEQLKQLITEPNVMEIITLGPDECPKPVPLIRGHKRFPFTGPLAECVVFPKVFFDIGKLKRGYYHDDYAEFVNFTILGRITRYLITRKGIKKITYAEACKFVGMDDDTELVVQKLLDITV